MSTGQGDYGYVQDGEYTGGWSGSDASRDRAEREERTGRARHRREQVLKIVRLAGLDGLTVHEVEKALTIGHGHASGALSNLHKAGRLECLKERRGGQHIYVMPHAVNGRPTRAFGRRTAATGEVGAQDQSEEIRRLTAALEATKRALDVTGREAREAGYTTGHEEGHAIGWQEGYDAAVAVTTDSTPYLSGVHDGKREGEVIAARRIYEMVVGMQSQIPKTVQTHHGKCWMQHPACALNAVQRAAARMIPTEGAAK